MPTWSRDRPSAECPAGTADLKTVMRHCREPPRIVLRTVRARQHVLAAKSPRSRSIVGPHDTAVCVVRYEPMAGTVVHERSIRRETCRSRASRHTSDCVTRGVGHISVFRLTVRSRPLSTWLAEKLLQRHPCSVSQKSGILVQQRAPQRLPQAMCSRTRCAEKSLTYAYKPALCRHVNGNRRV